MYYNYIYYTRDSVPKYTQYYLLLYIIWHYLTNLHSDKHTRILMETTKYNNWTAHTVQLVVKHAAGVRNIDVHVHPSHRYRVVRARGYTLSCIDTIFNCI
jgi:hypothetical protein